MDTVINVLRFLHITAGFISLITFWIPAVTQKGGKIHRQSGKLYVLLMWVVSITAMLLSIKNLVIGSYSMAAFLGFIALITANALAYGVAVLKNKKEKSRSYENMRLAFSGTIVLSALLLIAYGVALKGEGPAVLMFVFGGLGLTELRTLIQRMKGREERNWIKEHIAGMCSSGIAAYTAFFVFGGNRFFSEVLPGQWAIIPWIAPGIVGFFGIRRAMKRYSKK